VGKPEEWEEAPRGRNPWHVPIQFDVTQGDVLWDPVEHLLVDEEQLLPMPAAQRFKKMRKSGETLNPAAARLIDTIIDDSILLGGSKATPVDEAAQSAKYISIWRGWGECEPFVMFALPISCWVSLLDLGIVGEYTCE